MESNIQQQRQKKEGQGSPDIQTVSENDGQEAGICPNCNAEMPEEALFCPECGFSLKQLICPKCGTPSSPTADICQICGTWLLEGKCKFCYTDLSSDEALFCPECGKPKDGIPCPNCGKISIFDFCSKCGKPVTEEAFAELKHAQEQMASQQSFSVSEAAVPEVTALETEALEAVKKTFISNQDNTQAAAHKSGNEADLTQLETLINNNPEQEESEEIEEIKNEVSPSARKSLFSNRQMASIRKTGAVVDEITRKRLEAERIAEEKRRAEEAERKQQEIRKQTVKRFSSHQEARRWYMSNRLPNARGWLCNWAGTVHLYPEGPNECGNPAMGGCDYFEEPVWGENKYGTETWIPK